MFWYASPDAVRGQIIGRAFIAKGMAVRICLSHFEADAVEPDYFPPVAVLDQACDLPDIGLLSIYSPYQASQIYTYDNEVLSLFSIKDRGSTYS